MLIEPMVIGALPSTKNTFRIDANAKHRNIPRIISAVRAASIAGRTIDVIIITCCTNLMNESSGAKAHRTLAPANARYARRQTMWGGKESLLRRERVRTAKMMEIVANAGQTILFSGRFSMRLCSVSLTPAARTSNGDTTVAKTHAEIGTITHLSIIGVEDLARPNSKECTEAL